MQFIVESELSVAVFVGLALLMMVVATYFIFISRRSTLGSQMPGAPPSLRRRWLIPAGSTLPTIIAFGMMFIGMALVGAWYYIQIPIMTDYTFNILAVTLVAAIIAAVTAYGIALIGLYATSLRGRKV